ncbi:MAG: hypothetical protein EAX89_12325 [Candidatus Lokiarchaeota archaeon]|nr:hypothetical protein [Candidatus Lokiarchaeota archaeon]
MSDQLKLVLYIKSMISDLIYLNSVIASELMKITENLAAIRHGENFLEESSCISEHKALNQEVIKIVSKYNKEEIDLERLNKLENHLLKHP